MGREEYFMIQFCGVTAAQQLPEKLYPVANIATPGSCARELSLYLLYYVEIVSCVSQMSEH